MVLSLHFPPSTSTDHLRLFRFVSPTGKNNKTDFQLPRRRFLPTSRTTKSPPLRAQSLPSASTIESFWQWLAKRDVVPSVNFEAVPEGMGLVAREDLGKGELVVEVPKSLWINNDSVMASGIGSVCGGLKPWVSISLFLLTEKGKGIKSDWKPYLDILPEVTDSPLFWSEEDLLEIKGTQLLQTTLGLKEYIKFEFQRVEEDVILPNKHMFPSTFSLPDFFWAFGILRSRAFPRLGDYDLSLIPLADFINHGSGITTRYCPWEIGTKGIFSQKLFFSLKTPVYVKAGDQVFIQYDLDKSNAELALDYGFIENNPNRNTYTLTLEIAESDPFYDDKLDIAESNGMGKTAYFDIVLGQPLPTQMLPYLRLAALGGTDAFLLESIFRKPVWDHLELPVSQSNEEFICKVIRKACESALSAHQTTIEQDERIMEQGNLDPRLGIAVGIRIGEKKILKMIDGIFQDRELELDILEYYQERRLKDLGLVGEQGEIIFWE
ncbi:[Fructose-bisphosphate aldolase]-lysine N-methyltransferase,chloroplastic [Zostera marina]|uniref:[Fructose-bisphosphate aldolase]-lysine N-methyltransferase,chloroplastic n=1 Tax=Zostera marina TaxID=29655 RepID=A0A0K9PQ20_ZOSMR|nr:[Fructose-bisphosphate aldolase]-lysine N-methyltransferase,chloroplastic [Zostera marina]